MHVCMIDAASVGQGGLSMWQAWFVAGTIPLILGGGLHVLGTLVDTVRPTYFTPVDDATRTAADGTSIRLTQMSGLGEVRPSMWRVWLGIHISHGLGILAFEVLCLLIVAHDPDLVVSIAAM